MTTGPPNGGESGVVLNLQGGLEAEIVEDASGVQASGG